MSSEEETGTDPAENPDQEPRKTSAGSDLIIPVSGVVFALYYFSTIIESPWTAQVSAFFIGMVLILLSAILVMRTVLALRAGTARFDFRRVIEPKEYLGKYLMLLALTVAYIYVIRWAGFTLTTFIFLALAMLLLNEGRNKPLILALSAAMALGGWAVFILAFGVRFPVGPFEQLMKGFL